MSNNSLHGIPTILLLLMSTTAYSVETDKTAGTVEFSRGIATAQKTGQAPRIIGKDGIFFENEVLSTSDKSFVVIRLKDDSRMTLRPNTKFAVERINANRNQDDDAVLQLFKGGLRAVTGFISKFSNKANRTRYQVKTPVATIGIRGTEFDARICDNDCQQSGNQDATTTHPAAAKIAFAKGLLTARNEKGENRNLKTGHSVYEGDTLSTASDGIAVLVFPDNSRISLQPNTLFRVERFRFRLEKAQQEEEGAVLNLIKGGLRVITGLLGKSSPRNYHFKTPVATIGIRGTGFDLQCQGKCVDRFYNSHYPSTTKPLLSEISNWLIPSAYAQTTPNSSGLLAHVWSGSIEFQLADRTLLLSENQTAFLPNNQTQPLILHELPASMKNNPAPRPDKVDIKPDTLFESPKDTPVKAGLYVSVDDGQVDVDGVSVNPGEAAFAGGNNMAAIKLETIPEFILQDPFPKPGQLNESAYKRLRTPGNNLDEFECEVR